MAFQKGQSGNPNGRPRGSKDRRSILREKLESMGEDLLKAAVEIAINGNETMLKFLLERILPAKPREEPIIDPIELEGTMADQACEILKAVKDGDITPNEGVQVMSVLESKIRIVEFSDIETRLNELQLKLTNKVTH